jgi:nucleotide-binding universal stress UspA family protein
MMQMEASLPSRERHGMDVDTVVFATDLSDWSHNAGLYAAAFAQHFHARLLVAHAFVPSQAAMEAEAEGTPSSRQRTELSRILARRASALAWGPIEPQPLLLEGTPQQEIPRLAEAGQHTLLALGTHGGSRLERTVLGSVAEAILRAVSTPCLTVGPKVPPVPHAGPEFRRILYATDLTPAASRAALFAVFFAEKFGANIDVLHAVHDERGEHAHQVDDLRKGFREALDGLVPRYADQFAAAQIFAVGGGARRKILEHIKEHKIDLLVLGIHKTPHHLGLEVRNTGAFQLLAMAACPVLTVVG